MLRDVVSRAVLEKETEEARYLTLEPFTTACASLLTDKIDSQHRFRELLDRFRGPDSLHA